MVRRRWRWALAAGACLVGLQTRPAITQEAANDQAGVAQVQPAPAEGVLPPPRTYMPESPYAPLVPNTVLPGGLPPAAGPWQAADPSLVPPGSGPVAGTPCGPNGARPRRSFWRWLQECFIGLPQEFKARPFGQALQQTYNAHVGNGIAARTVLYNYDFVQNCPDLNQHGKDQLAKICGLLARSPCPLVIERTPWDPRLALARREAVLRELATGPLAVAPERVVIGPPSAIGISGVESDLVYRNLLQTTTSQGMIGGAAGGGGLTSPFSSTTSQGLSPPGNINAGGMAPGGGR